MTPASASRWQRLRAWQQVVVIYAASRVVTTVLIGIFAWIQPATNRTPAHPDIFSFSTIWDGQWYWLISLQGYPSSLPHYSDGSLAENAWAFLPGYPFLMTVLTLGNHIPFPVMAPIVSAIFGGAAAVVFRLLMRERFDERRSMWATVLFCAAPLSPMLQVSYAEPMNLFLLFVCLLLLMRRRYLTLIPVMVLMAFTRPTGLAFGLLLLLHLIARFATRKKDPFSGAEAGKIVLAGVTVGIAWAAWPVIAAIATGVPTAYTDTELVWRRAYIGDQELLPFTAWFQGAHWWLNYLGAPAKDTWTIAIVLVVALIVATIVLLFLPPVRRLGSVLRFWVASYAVYLLAVFFPQSSTFRLFLPFAPLLGAVPVPRSRIVQGAIVGVLIVLQVVWLYVCWWVNGRDWTVP